MMALEDAGGSMLKTRLPHSRHRKASVDLADAAVEKLFSGVRDATMIQGRTVFQNEDSYAPTMINIMLILFANYSWRHAHMGPGVMQEVKSMNRAAKRHQNKLARKATRNRRGHPPRPLGQNPSGTPASHFSELVQKASRLHQAGQMREAETIYRQVLDINPDHADANHLLGVMRYQLGDHAQAVESISRAIAMAPDQPMYHSNLGTALHELGRLEEAVASYHKALAIKPDYADAHNNLGIVFKTMGRLEEAVASYHKTLAIKPDHVEAHSNLGNALKRMGRLEEAVASYRKALAIKPDYAAAHSNLGNALQEMGRLEEAVASHHKALAIKPEDAQTHNNMGTVLNQLGRLEETVASYHKALAIKPDFAEAWNNLTFATKALHFSEAQGDRTDDLFKDGLSHAARATSDFAMLEYYLDGFKPHEVNESFRKATAALPPKCDEEVTGNGTNDGPANPPQLPDRLVALLHFGRSGTGLLHSLIDGHPEISTLPSIYLSGFFNAGVWNKIAAGGWRGLPERFVDEFAVLFDAASPKPFPGFLGEDTSYTGRKEGMTTVGESRNESLTLDRTKFCAEAFRLMSHYETINPGLFLSIIHAAFEKTIGTTTEKHTVFYHIHNPDDFAKLNFLRYAPGARLVMMVREPIQSCESWIRVPFEDNDYDRTSLRIIAMLFAIDQVAFRTQDSVGIRLEDLKERPKATLRGLCAWLDVEETPSLYQTTAQGKKWWGDPSSPDYDENEATSPFDDAPIRRAVGKIFSDKDQFVLRTLFYPISIRFGYRESDPIEFRKNLREIRPLLDDMLDFEKVMSERSGIDRAQFKRSGTYLLLRASFMDRWEVLNEFGDYPNMLTPLDIE
jgi:tetratricopeptide (TPR) repeat protein